MGWREPVESFPGVHYTTSRWPMKTILATPVRLGSSPGDQFSAVLIQRSVVGERMIRRLRNSSC